MQTGGAASRKRRVAKVSVGVIGNSSGLMVDARRSFGGIVAV
jgi:hypothetical protein